MARFFLFAQGTFLLIFISSIDSVAIRHLTSSSYGVHRQSKAGNLADKPLTGAPPSQPEPMLLSSYDVQAEAAVGESDPASKPSVFYGDVALGKANPSMGATFENIAPNYIGPNYLMSGGVGSGVSRNSAEGGALSGGEMMSGLGFSSAQGNPLSSYYQSLLGAAGQLPGSKVQSPPKPAEDTINDVFNNAFKKYNVKRYLLQKIFGATHDLDEDDGGFFSNKHLKRHGTAGMAAKVLGELIGIKIRESIEGFGKSFSEYAKDFTARNFVNVGQVFSRMLKLQRSN